jgi:glutaredoxin
MLKRSGHEPTVMKLGTDYTVEDFKRKFPGERAVPQIVINEKHFNSLESLRIFLNSDT